MTDLRRDPIVNVIHNGIKRDIRVALDNQCYRAALILTFVAVDAMAFLGLPEAQVEVQESDFVSWADRYIDFGHPHQPTGVDLYGSRCALVHSYGTESRKSRSGQCRQILYFVGEGAHVVYRPDEPDFVMVEVRALAERFFGGVDRFLVDLYADSQRGRIADQRFSKLVHELPGPQQLAG